MPNRERAAERGSVKTAPLLGSGRRAHFLRAERHDRFRGGQKPSGKVAASP